MRDIEHEWLGADDLDVLARGMHLTAPRPIFTGGAAKSGRTAGLSRSAQAAFLDGAYSMRQASLSDLDQLLALMAEFYAEAGYPLHSTRAAEAFRALLSDERLGRVWLIEAEGSRAGYMVVTLGYSMEYGGLDAFIDDLYVRPAFRHAGLGTAAVKEARAFCESRGVRALHLEVGQENAVAQSLYRRAGFVSNGRQLLTLRLAAPTHAS